ncbi:stalk domain-containing protein [Desulfotomaculum sp. 1211_IL3151]|uniref:stalk domain-containing protein n=1 Tax=Desulfotomaculum sp. 1211_IL3151 TaxID=3084055 RepID=UPI002FDAE782
MKKYLILLLSLMVCFSFILPAGAGELSGDKRALLEKINTSISEMNMDLSSTATGFSEYKLNELTGGALLMVPQLANMQGAKISFDYNLNAPAGQMGMQWKMNYQGKTYQGDLYLDGSRIIFTKDFLVMIKEISPATKIPDLNTMPQYLYVDQPEFAQMWSSPWLGSQINRILPLQNELLTFFLEAIPNNTISSNGSELKISINQQQFAACLAGIMEKVQKEPERFADLMAKYITTLDPNQSDDELRSEILAGLKEDNNKVTSADDIVKSMAEAGLEFRNLTYVVPRGKNGPGSFSLNMGIKNPTTSESLGEMDFKVDQVKNGDKVTGDMNMEISGVVKEQNIRFSLKLVGDYDQTKTNATSNTALTIRVDQGSMKMLNLGLDILSQAKVDKNVETSVPVLTPENSFNLEQLTNEEEETVQAKLLPGLEKSVHVVINGKPLHAEVKPVIKEGRTMVPLKNLAEALGCKLNMINDHELYLAKENNYVMLRLGEIKYTVNGKDKILDVPAFAKNGQILVPLRLIVEDLGYQVKAEGDVVYITGY